MRFFNTEGPIRPDDHYHVPPLDRVNLDDLLGLVRDKRYFVLHAPRQTGKTSALLALRDLLNGGGDYRCVYVTVEAAQALREDVAEGVRTVLAELGLQASVTLGDETLEGIWPGVLERVGAGQALLRWSMADPQPLVLLIEARIAERVPSGLRRALEHLLNETVDAGVTRFVWLRQFEPGNNSADANRLLDRLDHLQRLDFPESLFDDIPAHRITRLRRQGERYFADGLRELPENRRLAILAVCAVEWEMFLADAVVETHDRIVGRTYRTAVRTCRLLPSLMPTAACRSRPVRTIGSPSAGPPWTRACAGWPPQRGPVRSRAGASKTACSASRGRKPPCRTGPLTWSPTSTDGCPRRGSRTSCSRWTTPPGSPRPSRTCEPASPAATASVCSTCCSPRESTSASARWPRPRPRTGSGS